MRISDSFRPRLLGEEIDIGARGLVRPDENGAAGVLSLMQLRRSDYYELERIRQGSMYWLVPWEATVPPGSNESPKGISAYIKYSLKETREGRSLPCMLVLDNEIVGQLTFSGIQRGPVCSGSVGYWLVPEVGGRGIMTLALAMAIDAAIEELKLHRVEINIRPENYRSIAVVEKLKLREEGLRRGFIHIAGSWCDHRSFAITAEEIPPGGMVVALEKALASR